MSSFFTGYDSPDYHEELRKKKLPRHRGRVENRCWFYLLNHPDSKVPFCVLWVYYWIVEGIDELREGWRNWG